MKDRKIKENEKLTMFEKIELELKKRSEIEKQTNLIMQLVILENGSILKYGNNKKTAAENIIKKHGNLSADIEQEVAKNISDLIEPLIEKEKDEINPEAERKKVIELENGTLELNANRNVFFEEYDKRELSAEDLDFFKNNMNFSKNSTEQTNDKNKDKTKVIEQTPTHKKGNK